MFVFSGSDAVCTSRQIPAFRKKILSPSSVTKMEELRSSENASVNRKDYTTLLARRQTSTNTQSSSSTPISFISH
jgi:hypothetical protein